ncbi:MAG: bifunctional ornithine acetyltransferase/N-acetylglutamate synthase, partial [Candidatus Omnitrophota bacterium]
MSRKHLREGVLARAIIANSGNANSCTGQRGYKDAIAMANMAAKSLGKKADIKPEDVLVASTGHIGRFLDVSKIKKAMPALIRGLSGTGSERAAKAIMTTDTKPKQVSVKVKIGSSDVVIGGIAKGAGMIHPNLATMLCFITTDAYITRRGLRLALQTAAETSFNAISVDGDMSTNDSVMALANGLAKNSLIDKAGKDFAVFSQALGFVCLELAKMIVKDGEGASKFVEIHIKNAPDIRRAVRAGKAVAASNLLKTCVYGGDPNWGR